MQNSGAEEGGILDDPETPGVEMTDVGKEKDRSDGSGEEHPDADAGNGHCRDQENPLGSFALDSFEDFEEFVLDFDDYDLLESIHSHLGSPDEPIRKCACC